MESAQKKLDFDSHDESAEDHAFDDKFCFPEDDHHLSMGLTSSPLSRKLQMQSPRKIKRHINFNFRDWKDEADTHDVEAEAPVRPMLPPSPVASRVLPDILKPPLTYSPPYKRVRALRLFDTPGTPKTIYEKSNLSRALLQADCPRPVPAAFKQAQDKPFANTNPFTPDVLLKIRKRTRSIRNLTSMWVKLTYVHLFIVFN